MFDNSIFRTELQNRLSSVGASITYTIFESIFMEQLNKQAPMKEKYVRANNAALINKNLSKVFMNRSRLRNIYPKQPNIINKSNYKKQRNYCVNLLRKSTKEYYETLDLNKIIDNKLFWKTMKPFFSEKCRSNKITTLIDGENIIINDTKIAETMNKCFSNAVEKLDIKGYQTSISPNVSLDKITYAITKFKDHPSITDKFSFAMVN